MFDVLQTGELPFPRLTRLQTPTLTVQTAARAPGGEFGRAAEEEARAEDARLARGRAEGHEPAEGQPPVDRGGPAIYAETFERGLLTAPANTRETANSQQCSRILLKHPSPHCRLAHGRAECLRPPKPGRVDPCRGLETAGIHRGHRVAPTRDKDSRSTYVNALLTLEEDRVTLCSDKRLQDTCQQFYQSDTPLDRGTRGGVARALRDPAMNQKACHPRDGHAVQSAR